MKDPNSLTAAEYREIYNALREYVELKKSSLQNSTMPFYVKDVANANVNKVKTILSKMKCRMEEFRMHCC